ncbi:retrovirus-related pol polyprotein from transposon TNT 1-94 [Tanacetum coccineum]
MYVKTSFLNGPLKEVFVREPGEFVDPDFPNYVYCLKKLCMISNKSPRAWYDKLSSFLIDHHFTKGIVDPTLFTRRHGDDILLVQIYVDNIIFGSTNPVFSNRFSKLMKDNFEMSMMGEMKLFLGLQARPIEKHLKEVKRIFRYLKQTYNIGLCYSKDSGFELIAYSDADLAGCHDDYKSTYGGIQFLHVEQGTIELYFVGTEYQLAYIFTKALPKERIRYLVYRIGMRCMTPTELERIAKLSS